MGTKQPPTMPPMQPAPQPLSLLPLLDPTVATVGAVSIVAMVTVTPPLARAVSKVLDEAKMPEDKLAAVEVAVASSATAMVALMVTEAAVIVRATAPGATFASPASTVLIRSCLAVS